MLRHLLGCARDDQVDAWGSCADIVLAARPRFLDKAPFHFWRSAENRCLAGQAGEPL